MSADSRAKDLFLDALELEGDEREAWLAGACGGDRELRAQVDALLAAHGRAEGVLGRHGATSDSVGMLGLASRALVHLDLGPGDEVGDYRLGESLGEGGFGRVFRAEQLRPVRRQVALKLLKLGMDSRRVMARFEAERHVLARMEHPHIARVLDAGEAPDGRPFFVMELVEGEPVTSYCRRRALSLEGRLELFRLTCLAIQHAHSKGVLHRDIKPSNVLVTEVDGQAQPRVIDFGVAKATAPEALEPGAQAAAGLTAEGHLVGTPAYMSPELMDTAADVDTRSDVYALGVLLYELVAGAPPFTPEGTGIAALVDLRRQLQEREPVPPSRARRTGAGHEQDGGVAGAVPPEIDWITLRAIEREREHRYPTAAALAAEVERLLAGLPVEAAPRSRSYRLRKLVGRHRAASAFAAAALLALVLGVAGTTRGMVRAGRLNAELQAALEEVEREAAEARAQSGIAEAVNAFLTRDLLSAARPSLEQGSGRDVMMSEVLAAATERIDRAAEPGGRFAELPRVEGRVRQVLGQTLLALGRWDEALPQLDRAMALLDRELGPRHPEVLRCRFDRALAVSRGKDAEGALRELEGLLPLLREELGPADPLTLRALELQGSAAHWRDRLGDSAAILSDGLDEVARAGKQQTPEAAALVLSMAMVRADDGRLAEAEPLFREAIEVLDATAGPLDRETLEARANLGVLLMRLGRPQEAAELLEQVVPPLREALGAEHEVAIVSTVTLASARIHLADFTGAAELAREAHERASQRFGPEHELTLLALDALAVTMDARGDFEGALAAMEELARLSDRGRPTEEARARVANLAVLLYEHGRCAEARAPLARALELSELTSGRGSPLSVQLVGMQGACARRAGDVLEAELLLMEALERGAGLSSERFELRQARTELGLLCRDQERWEEAVELFEQNREVLRATVGEQDERYLMACSLLLDTFVRAGWTGEARALEDEVGARLDGLEGTAGLLRPSE